MQLYLKLVLFLAPFVAWFLVLDFFLTRYASRINVDVLNSKARLDSSEKVPAPPKWGVVSPKYIVTGGAGFVGSWISRFLLFRGINPADITILDNNPRAPPDLIKYGVKYINVDLTDDEALIKELDGIVGDKGGVNLVVYHAAAIQRHYIGYRFYDRAPAKQNVNMAQSLVEAVNHIAARLEPEAANNTITVINIGDAQSDYEAPRWWQVWDFNNWVDTYKRGKVPASSRKYLSSYAQSKAEAEAILLSEKSFASSNKATCVKVVSLRVQGIVTGYYGEPILSPAMYYGGIIDHQWSIPTCFIHVEDVCRAALLAENALAKEVCGEVSEDTVVSWHSFVVSNGQTVRFGDAMKSLVESDTLRDIRINPGLVLATSFIVNLLLHIYPGPQKKWRSRDTSVFSGRWWVLTPERFATVQTAQIPVASEIARTRRALGFLAVHGALAALQDQAADFGKHKDLIRKSAVAAQEQEGA
ncbi:uncharacterized protein SAPINGB_P001689 [Magnusiomyces paraingens]|uniref:NAD-dependent epimerase/dehydratase domain-containing protein n=1 Tax=Magnusiomyces paraingens TaxID=2606893 RepID=A0A5E8B7K8_9ASCO|nr:uncharacterized protein SAPINGB_P001689 [Saprochaete ingens]VVT47394.1 unnamed protein product [Saprochaete ingens]